MKKRLLDWIVCPQLRRTAAAPGLPGREGRSFRRRARSRPARFYCGRHDVARPQDITPPPDCNSCYREEILEAALSCVCGLVYPVIDGIPRMLRNAKRGVPGVLRPPRPGRRPEARGPARPSPTAAAPGASACSGPSTARGTPPGSRTTRGCASRSSSTTCDTTPEELRDSTLLDGGCGNGELTRAVAEYGPEIVAMDFSRSVENASAAPVRERRPRLAQGALPAGQHPGAAAAARRASTWSTTSGVLHHTPSTYRAFRSISGRQAGGQALRPALPPPARLDPRRQRHAAGGDDPLPMRLLYGLCYVATPVHAAGSRG